MDNKIKWSPNVFSRISVNCIVLRPILEKILNLYGRIFLELNPAAVFVYFDPKTIFFN